MRDNVSLWRSLEFEFVFDIVIASEMHMEIEHALGNLIGVEMEVGTRT